MTCMHLSDRPVLHIAPKMAVRSRRVDLDAGKVHFTSCINFGIVIEATALARKAIDVGALMALVAECRAYRARLS